MSERQPFRRRTLWMFVAIATTASLLAGITGAYATNKFSDVPTGNPFHSDIEWMAETGITTGCGGGSFCPDASVKRQEMAAFMRRFFDLQLPQAWKSSTTITPSASTTGWTDIPGAGTGVFVPAGTAASAFATFSGDASCIGPVDGAFCSVRILIDGVEMEPAADDDNAFAATHSPWSSASLTRAGTMSPGFNIVKVQYRAESGVDFAIDNWLLAVDPQFLPTA